MRHTRISHPHYIDMKTLNETNIYTIFPLLEEFIKESRLTESTTSGYIMANMASEAKNKSGTVCVDDVQNPSYMFWGVVNKSAFLMLKTFHIAGIYIKKEARGDKVKVEKLMTEIEKQAKSHGCDVIFGASWILGDTEFNASKMWSKSGYERIETIHMKEVAK